MPEYVPITSISITKLTFHINLTRDLTGEMWAYNSIYVLATDATTPTMNIYTRYLAYDPDRVVPKQTSIHIQK